MDCDYKSYPIDFPIEGLLIPFNTQFLAQYATNDSLVYTHLVTTASVFSQPHQYYSRI